MYVRVREKECVCVCVSVSVSVSVYMFLFFFFQSFLLSLRAFLQCKGRRPDRHSHYQNCKQPPSKSPPIYSSVSLSPLHFPLGVCGWVCWCMCGVGVYVLTCSLLAVAGIVGEHGASGVAVGDTVPRRMPCGCQPRREPAVCRRGPRSRFFYAE